MVDYSHLSAGNSESSHPRDLLAEFGVSSQNTINMIESDPVHLDVSIGSAESDESSVNGGLEGAVNPAHASDLQDIVRAAQHFTQKDRLEAVAERKKSQDLIDFISAQGFSMNDVNSFLQGGSKIRQVNAHNMFVECPKSPLVPGRSSPEGIRKDIVDPSLLPSAVMEGGKAAVVCPNECADAKAGPPRDTQPPSWCEVVTGAKPNPSCTLSYFPPVLVDGAVTIKPPIDILKKGNSQWSTSLVGFFLHSRLPFKVVEETAFKLWNQYGLQRVYLHEKGFFIFKFQDSSARDNVLALGPWYFANKLLTLKYWKEGIDIQSEACTKAPIWVKFFGIPLSYWSAEGLSYLASGIGRPLFADKLTEKMDPMTFARVCIEIDVNSVLHDRLMVTVYDEEAGCEKALEVKVEYQSKPISCSSCKVFGHSLLKCPRANFQWVPKSSKSSSAPIIQPMNGDKVVSEGPSLPAESLTPLSNDVPVVLGQAEWTKVERGKGVSSSVPLVTSPGPYGTPTSNPFLLISNIAEVSPSSTDITPDPNPLVAKLKKVDEKDCRDLKSKPRSELDAEPVSKKKNKRGGGRGSFLKPPLLNG